MTTVEQIEEREKNARLLSQETEEIEDMVQFFFDSITSAETRENYMIYFKKYMQLQGVNEKDLLREKDPRIIEKEIITFVNKMKKKGMSYGAIKNYTTPILSFYKIHDIVLNTNKISKFMPENKRVKKDRGYTHEEISKLLEIADERSRVVILLLASTGMRIGAIPSLKIGNLEDNKITVYENTKEEYFTFVTPECKKAIDSYIDFRSRYGEIITDSSPLVRELFDIRNQIAIKNPKTIGIDALSWIIRDIAKRHNVLSKGVPSAHGFRKFWMSQAVESDMNPEIREMLLGHKIGLAGAYYKPTVERMYAEYEKALDNLTIDPSQRLQRKLDTVQQDNTQIQRLAMDMEKIKENLQLLAEGKARIEMSREGFVEEVWKVDKKGELTSRKVKGKRRAYY